MVLFLEHNERIHLLNHSFMSIHKSTSLPEIKKKKSIIGYLKVHKKENVDRVKKCVWMDSFSHTANLF